jgi:hypothetical protein
MPLASGGELGWRERRCGISALVPTMVVVCCVVWIVGADVCCAECESGRIGMGFARMVAG